MRYLKKYWVRAFLLGMLTACVGIAPHIIFGGGCLSMANDYSALFMPQAMMANTVIKSGNLLWNWGIDLGGNYLESFGLGSAFSWLLLLFSTEQVPYVMGWMITLKFAVAALTSALFFKRHFSDERIVIICSLLYSFSGYQIITMDFYAFQDFVALFPLMLLGIELLVEEKKNGLLLTATFLNAFCGIAVLFGEIVFLVLYYIVKYIKIDTFKTSKAFALQVQNAISCICEGGLGLACAGIAIIPAIRNLTSNNRVTNHIPVSSWFTISTGDLLQTIKAFLLPPEPMSHQASVYGSDWYSNATYLPAVGMVFALAYLLKNKDWKSRLAKICIIMAIVPVFNSIFMACSVEPYKRWYYMLSLVLVLITGCVLEQPECFPIKKSFALNLCAIFLFVFMTLILRWNSEVENLVFHKDMYRLNITVALIGVLISVFYSSKRKSVFFSVMTVVVILFGAGLMYYQIENCKNIDNSFIDFCAFDGEYSENVVAYISETSEDLSKDVLPYRYYFDENIGYTYYNLSMPHNLPSINSFCSTVHGSVSDFYNNLGVGRHTMTVSVGNGAKELLSAKYIVSVAEREDYKFSYTKKLSSGQNIYCYENEKALPIGFTYNQYISESEFKLIDPNYRPVVMLKALVIKDDDVASVSQRMSHFEECNFEELLNDINNVIEERRSESSSEFEYSNNKFSATISADSEKYAFFSVPYDTCWTATIDGENIPILNIEGLMAVCVPEGKSTISFRYIYTPLKYGALISITGTCISIIYIYIYLRKRRNLI